MADDMCKGTWVRTEPIGDGAEVETSIIVGKPRFGGYNIEPVTLARILSEAGYVRE